MTRRTTPPFRADHVGSLLRPPEVVRARAAHAAGEIDAAARRAAEDAAVDELVALQEKVGLQTATDGEVHRDSWHMDFIYRLGGVTKVVDELPVTFRNTGGTTTFTPSAARVDARLHLDETIFADDFGTLTRAVERHAPGLTPKLTIPSPSMVHYRGGRSAVNIEVYPEMAAFWEDLSATYAEEVRRLGELGCTYLQLDDVSLAYLNDPAQRASLSARGDDADHQHLRYIEQFNRAVTGRPSSMTVTTHLCRGNFRSSWVAEGGYDFVAEALFTELDVDGFFMEWDDERSGSFEPLRFVPPGKFVVLGLVTSKSGALEDPDAIKRRIDEAARYVPLDQLCLSPQCGFSSTADGNDLTPAQQEAKLRLVVDVAADVWG